MFSLCVLGVRRRVSGEFRKMEDGQAALCWVEVVDDRLEGYWIE